MTGYSILLTLMSERAIKKLKPNVFSKIISKLEGVESNPYKEGKLLSNLPERWKIYVQQG